VTLGEPLRAHEFALTFGGMPGVRDVRLLESAVARPYSGYYHDLLPEQRRPLSILSPAIMDLSTVTNVRAILMMFVLLVRSGYAAD
jgi:hypothetical protein